jgi:hypothetical protein
MAKTLEIGTIVKHADPFHRRGASTGAIEHITDQGWYQIHWEDCEEQIHPAARTYEQFELITIETKPC